MEKITFQLRKWAFLFTFLFSNFSMYAQKSDYTYRLGTTGEFLNQLKSQLSLNDKNSGKAHLQLYTSDNETLNSTVNYQKTSPEGILHLEGEVGESGSFTIKLKDNILEGNIMFQKAKKAFKYHSDDKGNAFIKEVDIHNLICIDFFALPTPSTVFSKSTSQASVYNLQSLPGAAGCLLLDFDGYTVPPGSGWNGGNPIAALPSGMIDANILEAWEIVSEDFRAFNLNITTDENIFNTYPPGKRKRCIITPTNVASSGGAGVALINSFSSITETPCWVFTLAAGTYGKIIGEVASHELGHTLGLYHDGQAQYGYYGGHGSWAPIMGISYYKNVTQWSKAEYSNGTNHEDDLAIISNSTNGVGYRQDNHGNTFSTATMLVVFGEQISASENYGVIDHTDDVDIFKFHANGGNVNLKIQASERHSNLLLKVMLYNNQHVLVSTFTGNPLNLSEPVFINTNLNPGDYYLSISGAGEGNPDTGYTNYASLGFYSISGTIPKWGVLATDEIHDIKVYPHLVTNDFTIDISTAGKYEVQIINSLGQLLYKKLFSEKTHQVAFSDKPTGTYFVILKNIRTGLQKSYSIIKQ